MAIDWLPQVNSCCFFIKNMKCATSVIGSYNMFRGWFSFLPVVQPMCHNLDRSSGAGLAEFIISIILAVAGGGFLIGSALMITNAFLKWGTTAIYVLSTFIMVPVGVIHSLTYLAIFKTTLNSTCIQNSTVSATMALPIPPGVFDDKTMAMITNLNFGLVDGAYLMYSAMVVNSFDAAKAQAAKVAASGWSSYLPSMPWSSSK